jgi:hypothetical protein
MLLKAAVDVNHRNQVQLCGLARGAPFEEERYRHIVETTRSEGV